MPLRGHWACLLCFMLLLPATAGAVDQLFIKGEANFAKGWVADSEDNLIALKGKSKDIDYPRYMLALGSAELSLGDYARAREAFAAAIADMTEQLSGVTTGMAFIKSESNRPYRGYPHEKMLAHTFLGLAYMQQGQLNEARIEFAQARESDLAKKAEHQGDFATNEFLDGWNGIRMGEIDAARVSFRKVTELRPRWALGWYALCRASEMAKDAEESNRAWSQYEALTTLDHRMARDGSTSCAIVIVGLGAGPIRKADAVLGQFGNWHKAPTTEVGVRLAVAGGSPMDVPAVDDLYDQARTIGGLNADVERKVIGAAAKEVMSHVPILGLFTPKSEADLRVWGSAPGTIHIAAIPVPAEPSTVELTCLDAKGVSAPIKRQVMYYVGGAPFERASVVYTRVMPNADYRETLNAPRRRR